MNKRWTVSDISPDVERSTVASISTAHRDRDTGKTHNRGIASRIRRIRRVAHSVQTKFFSRSKDFTVKSAGGNRNPTGIRWISSEDARDPPESPLKSCVHVLPELSNPETLQEITRALRQL